MLTDAAVLNSHVWMQLTYAYWEWMLFPERAASFDWLTAGYYYPSDAAQHADTYMCAQTYFCCLNIIIHDPLCLVSGDVVRKWTMVCPNELYA